jgi:hypothetical protein
VTSAPSRASGPWSSQVPRSVMTWLNRVTVGSGVHWRDPCGMWPRLKSQSDDGCPSWQPGPRHPPLIVTGSADEPIRWRVRACAKTELARAAARAVWRGHRLAACGRRLAWSPASCLRSSSSSHVPRTLATKALTQVRGGRCAGRDTVARRFLGSRVPVRRVERFEAPGL